MPGIPEKRPPGRFPIPTQVLPVVDRCSIHTAVAIREWVAENEAEIKLHYQPVYSPKGNPVELLRVVVEHKVSHFVSKTKAQILSSLEAELQSLEKSQR